MTSTGLAAYHAAVEIELAAAAAAGLSLDEYRYRLKAAEGDEPSSEEATLQQHADNAAALVRPPLQKGTQGSDRPALARKLHESRGLAGNEFIANQVRSGHFSASELREAGFKASEVRGFGFALKDMKRGGYKASELRASGVLASELKAAGFTARKLRKAGYTPKDLNKARFSGVEMREAGYDAVACKNGDFTAAELAVSFSCEELKGAFPLMALREAGYSAAELQATGFSLKQLHEVGFAWFECVPLPAPSTLPSRVRKLAAHHLPRPLTRCAMIRRSPHSAGSCSGAPLPSRSSQLSGSSRPRRTSAEPLKTCPTRCGTPATALQI